MDLVEKKIPIALFEPQVWPWEFFSKKGKHRPFSENSRSIKIILIAASVYEINAKYLTKHEFVHISMVIFLIWYSPEAVQYSYLSI